jgi:hypothetical protein
VILFNRGTFRGHQGVMQPAQMLGEELPNTTRSSTPTRPPKEIWRSWNGRTKTPTLGSPMAPIPT